MNGSFRITSWNQEKMRENDKILEWLMNMLYNIVPEITFWILSVLILQITTWNLNRWKKKKI